MSFDGNGNCSATKGFGPDSMCEGAVSTTDTYSVTADGKVTFGGASGMTDFIQVSPDGDVIVAAGFATDNVIMTVGIKENAALTNADMNGNWVYKDNLFPAYPIAGVFFLSALLILYWRNNSKPFRQSLTGGI